MKTITKAAFAAAAIILAAPVQSYAVEDQALQVQGTNLVLSWPSLGYEYYMIEYRPTLDDSTPFVQLTNCVPANSTNRTTYIIPCCALSALGGGYSAASISGADESLAFSAPPGASGASSFDDSSGMELWAEPADGSGAAVPLSMYPPGFDTNSLEIFEAPIPDYQAQSVMLDDASSGGSGTESPLRLSSGGCNCPDMGFFRVWHIPDWFATITNYTFNGPTFIPVDFKDYRDRVAKIEVLINGQPTPYSQFMPYDSGGQTYWGVGVYFDRIPSGTYQIQLRTTLRLSDEVGDGMAWLVLSNLTKTITVGNEI